MPCWWTLNHWIVLSTAVTAFASIMIWRATRTQAKATAAIEATQNYVGLVARAHRGTGNNRGQAIILLLNPSKHLIIVEGVQFELEVDDQSPIPHDFGPKALIHLKPESAEEFPVNNFLLATSAQIVGHKKDAEVRFRAVVRYSSMGKEFVTNPVVFSRSLRSAVWEDPIPVFTIIVRARSQLRAGLISRVKNFFARG